MDRKPMDWPTAVVWVAFCAMFTGMIWAIMWAVH